MNNELEHLIEQQEAIISQAVGVENSWKEFRRRWSIIFGAYTGGAISLSAMACLAAQVPVSIAFLIISGIAALLWVMNWVTSSTHIKNCHKAVVKFRSHLEDMKVTQREWRGY